MGLKVSRNWLLGGYHAAFSLQTPVADHLVPTLSHVLLQALRELFTENVRDHELSDIKGRDIGDVLLPNSAAPVHDEVLTIGGLLATAHDSRGFQWAPFRFSLRSDFTRFEGSSGIVFSLQPVRSEAMPEWLPWWLLGAAAPIKVEYLRLGLEVFTSKFKISRFGSIPVVSDSLLLDLSGNTLAIRLTTDQPRRRRCNPFETVPSFKRISVAIGSVLGLTLSTQFASELESSGAGTR